MSTLQSLNLHFENAETKLLSFFFFKKVMTSCPAEQPGAHIYIFRCTGLLQRLSVSPAVRGSLLT